MPYSATLDQMQHQLESWSTNEDPRRTFLACYSMMTTNMYSAVGANRFVDSCWVESLLENFAQYYFDALEKFEAGDRKTPEIWQYTFDKTMSGTAGVLESLILGVNAHINYDLVLALETALRSEESYNKPDLLKTRYADHLMVNSIISETIDAVQEEVLEPQSTALKLIDSLLGRIDEYLLSALITHWRENVWTYTWRLLTTESEDETNSVMADLRQSVIRNAHIISAL